MGINTKKQIKVAAAMEGQARQLANHELFEMAINAKYTTAAVLMVVILAALNGISIEMQADGISPDAVLYHLNQKLSLESVELLMKGAVRRTATLLKRRFGNRRFAIAMDYTDEMYYGELGHSMAVGTKPKDGSSHAYKYFTVSIVTEGARCILFCYPVFDRATPHMFFIDRALCFMEGMGIRPHTLLLDREFGCVDVIASLQSDRYRYVIPADHDSKFERKTKEVQKFPARFIDWQMANAKKEVAETDLVVIERFDKEGKRMLHGFLTNLPKSCYEEEVEDLARLYSRRWGIETAHREEDQFRLKTTSVNGVVRYLFFVIGVLIYNLWVELNLNLCDNLAGFEIQVRLWPMKQALIRLLSLRPA